MPQTSISLYHWLEECCRAISQIEEDAKSSITAGDVTTYRKILRRKAEFLENLPARGASHTGTLPIAERAAVMQRLEGFAQSARTALSMDSVFYMSALLFPAHHKPGEPNDLEVFTSELRPER